MVVRTPFPLVSRRGGFIVASPRKSSSLRLGRNHGTRKSYVVPEFACRTVYLPRWQALGPVGSTSGGCGPNNPQQEPLFSSWATSLPTTRKGVARFFMDMDNNKDNAVTSNSGSACSSCFDANLPSSFGWEKGPYHDAMPVPSLSTLLSSSSFMMRMLMEAGQVDDDGV